MSLKNKSLIFITCTGVFISCSQPKTGTSSSDTPIPPPSTPGNVTGRIGLSGESQYFKKNTVHAVFGDAAQIPFEFLGTGAFENFDVQLPQNMKKHGWAVDSDSLKTCAPGSFTSCQVILTYKPTGTPAPVEGTVSFSYKNSTGVQTQDIAFSYEAVRRRQWVSAPIPGLFTDTSFYRAYVDNVELNPNVIVDQDGSVYVIANDADKKFNHVIALGANGKQKWEFKVAIPTDKTDKKFTSLALVGNDQIYAGASTNEIYAIDKATGELKTVRTNNPFPPDVFNPSDSPIFSSAFAGQNGTLFATANALAGFTESGTFRGQITPNGGISSLAVDKDSGLVLYGEKGGRLKVSQLGNAALTYKFDLAINPNTTNDAFVPSMFGEQGQPRKILFNNAYQIVMLKDLNKKPMDGCQGVTCVAPDWQVQPAQKTFASSAAAQSDGNVVYVQSLSQELWPHLLAYDSSQNNTGSDAQNVKPIWENHDLASKLSPVATSSLAGNVVLVVPSKHLNNKTCEYLLCAIVSSEKGPIVRWSWAWYNSTDGPKRIVSKPVVSADGRTAYVVDESNKIHAINM